ncbi:hypothetical protein [Lysobacter sp. F6437]|uniref:hypothetical protein n=1 Tax=Lysobacter sp. F6437 TaxID=3459296 RepID=UPI00403DF2D1
MAPATANRCVATRSSQESTMRPHTVVPRRASGLLLTGLLAMPVMATATGPELQSNDFQRVEGFGPTVDAAGLARLRGGNSVENHVDSNGVVEGNHAENINSGDNTLAGGAFGNATGINTVIQNSGSNVLIQNGMVVNVQFTPTP